MQTIALIAQKGGAGKTTIAVSLAVVAMQEGKTVAIIDLDPQSSAGNWAERRRQDSPAVVSTHVPRLAAVIATARENGTDLLVIDTPGKSEQAALAAAKAADLILIPSRPQIYDLETLAASKEIIDLAGRRPAFVVLNAVPPQGHRHDEARAIINEMNLQACTTVLVQRAAYGDAPNAGQGVTEYEPSGKAAEEIRQVWKFTSNLLYELTRKEAHDQDEPSSSVA